MDAVHRLFPSISLFTGYEHGEGTSSKAERLSLMGNTSCLHWDSASAVRSAAFGLGGGHIINRK